MDTLVGVVLGHSVSTSATVWDAVGPQRRGRKYSQLLVLLEKVFEKDFRYVWCDLRSFGLNLKWWETVYNTEPGHIRG